ncbi:MAG: glycerophosphodiester phosphodiesterase, partial [Planctomycetes bacterium]|nr:glycerophosphodiester phosphodiesterase [Planctomycetota bacterium]
MRICAHRGASRGAPENTVEALRLAIEGGADSAEVDVRLSADRVAVLCHDDHLGRIIGVPVVVRDCTLLQIRAVVGNRVPSLAEALAATGRALPLNLELKGVRGQKGLPERVVAELRRAGRIRGTLVTSFAPRLALAARRLAPGLRIGAVLAAPVPGLPRHPVDVFAVEARAVTRDLVDAAHARGAEIHAWTVNRAREARRLAALG